MWLSFFAFLAVFPFFALDNGQLVSCEFDKIKMWVLTGWLAVMNVNGLPVRKQWNRKNHLVAKFMSVRLVLIKDCRILTSFFSVFFFLCVVKSLWESFFLYGCPFFPQNEEEPVFFSSFFDEDQSGTLKNSHDNRTFTKKQRLI